MQDHDSASLFGPERAALALAGQGAGGFPAYPGDGLAIAWGSLDARDVLAAAHRREQHRRGLDLSGQAEWLDAADRPHQRHDPGHGRDPACGRSDVVTPGMFAGHVMTAPGPGLAGWLSCTPCRSLDDAALVTSITGWRKLTSWAQAQELAAVAELARRRGAWPGAEDSSAEPAGDLRPPAGDLRPPATGPRASGPDSGQDTERAAVLQELAVESAPNEVALALTLTRAGAGYWMDLAVGLAGRLPRTLAALGAGRIDLNRARLIEQYTSHLSPGLARKVEDRVLPRAEGQTSGRLRAALARAVMAADPAAAERRRQEAEQDARVELAGDHEGTASLGGRFLPATQAAAAWARICAMAKAMESAGATGGADLLRAQVFTGLLLGTLPLIPPTEDGPVTPPPDDAPPEPPPPDDGPKPPPPPDDGPKPPPLPDDAPPPAACGPAAPAPPDGGRPAEPPDGGRPAEPPADADPPADGRPAVLPPPPAWPPVPPPGHTPAPGCAPAWPSWLPGPAQTAEPGSRQTTSHDTTRHDTASNTTASNTTASNTTSGNTTSGNTTSGNTTSGNTTSTAGKAEPGKADPGTARRPGRHGRAFLSVPWRTLAGLAAEPGSVSRIGPVTAEVARAIAAAAVAGQDCEWRLTVTGSGGGVVAAVSVPRTWSPRPGSPGRGTAGTGPGLAARITMTFPLALLAAGGPAIPDGASPPGLRPVLAAAVRAAARAAARFRAAQPPPGRGCSHAGEVLAYRVPDSMRALLEARDQTCRFPTCGQPAWRCDQDHTQPYHRGGRTCPCNLGAACRHHHRLKQLDGWQLTQPSPGTLIWHTPARLTYTVRPQPHE